MRFKSSFWLCAAIAALPSFTQAAPARQIVPQGLVSYSSNVTEFAVWLPAPIKFPGHNDFVSVFSPADSKGKTDTVAFFVTFGINLGQNPPSGPKVSIEKHLAGIFDGYRVFSQPDSFQSQRIELNGVPGYELSYVAKLGIKGNRLRMYETPQRLYQIHAAGTESALEKNRALVDKVFASFRILPRKNQSEPIQTAPTQ
ncbi:hypothetical protein B1R32_108174 [Abditibacterium utsteinense]|uniref:PsbP protein n=1 Tax=Abditibacterium utsteinense TaxID=1960156 RepID=A0A2S8ST33_9BACT|nr:hypothetical protein [Abditibacterium utsteinense]PQV63963.1 hypothetical protein B1R32_108174 [Abditibacterium utsteinense]